MAQEADGGSAGQNLQDPVIPVFLSKETTNTPDEKRSHVSFFFTQSSWGLLAATQIAADELVKRGWRL